MMFCHNCGNNLDENARFCAKCGTPVSAAPAAPAEEPAVEAAPAAEPVVEAVPAAEPVAEPAAPENPATEAIPASEPAPEGAAPQVPPIPTYMPPQYAMPAEAPAPRGSKGMSVASLIIGICSFTFCWIPFFMVIPELLALIFGIVGIRNRNGKGMAITGLVLSIVALLVTLLISVLILALTSEGLLVDSSYYYY